MQEHAARGHTPHEQAGIGAAPAARAAARPALQRAALPVGNQARQRLLLTGGAPGASQGSAAARPPPVQVTQAPQQVQRGGYGDAMIMVMARERRVRDAYNAFIRSARSYGMPTRFLDFVGARYTFVLEEGSDDFARPGLNEMHLSEDTVSSIGDVSPALPLGEATAILTLYHEATHAYLDLVEDEPRVQAFIQAGEGHYQGAPLREGGTTSDAGRMFQEAAASYVGGRAAGWWSAFEMLSIYASMGKLSPERVQRVRADYNQAMAERVFGYSDEGGFLGFGTHQAETSRPMTPAMKAFLDHEVLEDKIPDSFDAVAGFQAIISRAASAPVAPAPARP